MFGQKGNARGRAQIALEFMIVYSFVLVLFVLMFTLVSTQRAASMSQQEYSMLQLQAQNIADYIDQAIGAGSGYAATIPITGSIGAQPFNVSISTTGVVIAQTKVGTQIIRAYAFSNARNLIINGTQTQTGNGITVYLVPIQRGSLYLANSNGAIYVDTPPASTLPLAKSVMLTSIANTKVASFNGQSSYIDVGNRVTTIPLPQITITAWIYRFVPASGGQDHIFSNWVSSYHFILNSNKVELDLWSSTGKQSPALDGATTIQNNKWYFITGTFDGTTMTVYVNGVADGSTTSFSGNIISSSTSDTKIGAGGAYPPTWANYLFNGLISDVQIYNTALTSNQIASLYTAGIGGAPIVSASIVGWWPLNGGATDYSGNNNNGATTNVIYQSVAQINAQVNSGSGANVINTPMGFVTSNGVLGPNGNSLVLYTSATGSSTVFVSSNGLKGIANLTINTFNDNLTTVGNLVGWWPIDEGYGNIAYDLSGKYNNGAFTNPSWVAFANQTNLAAASFSGANSYINLGNYVYPTNGLNTAITVSAWIAPSTTSSRQAIIKKTSSSNVNGWVLGINTGGALAWYVYTNSWQGNWGFTTNTVNTAWNFVTCTWDGYTMSCYINGVKDPNTMSASGSFSNSNDYTYIGQEPYQGASQYSGLISDVQIYNTALSPSQIMQLYQEGISGSPIGDAGLVDWWPLGYSSNDYSSNKNNGVPTSVTFSNVQYTNPTSNSVMKVANFNGASSYINAGNPTQLQITGGITACAWVNLNSNLGKDEILSKWDASGQLSYSMAYDQPDSVYFAFWISTTGSDAPYAYSGSIATPSKFYFVCGVYDTHTISLFLNGVNSTHPQTQSGAIFNGNSNFRIGYGTPGSSYFNGKIADVQIYNSVLTPTQIQQMYQQGLPMYSKMNVSLG